MNSTLVPRVQVENAITGTIVLNIIAICFMAVLLILLPWGIWENRNTADFGKNPGSRGCIWLLCMAVTHMCFACVQLNMVTENFLAPGMDISCNHRARFLAFAWILGKQFMYLFLFERALVVNRSVVNLGRAFTWMRNAIGFVIIIGIPGVFYWAVIVLFNGLVFQREHVCAMVTNALPMLILFSGFDFVLSISLLTLFLFPLRQHLRYMKKTNMEDNFHLRLKRVLKKNSLLSTVALLSATIALVMVAVFIAKQHITDSEGEDAHELLYAMYAPTMDTMVGLFAVLQISDLWRPKLIKWSSSEKSSSKTGNKSKPRVVDTVEAGSTPIVPHNPRASELTRIQTLE